MKILKEILLFFQKSLKSLSKFSRKFEETFRYFQKFGFLGVRGGAPEASEIIKNLVEKSMEPCKLLKNFHEFLANFDLKKLISIKIKEV